MKRIRLCGEKKLLGINWFNSLIQITNKPPPQTWFFFWTLPARDSLGNRVGFPRKEERKANLPLVPRETLAETSAMLEKKEKHRENRSSLELRDQCG